MRLHALRTTARLYGKALALATIVFALVMLFAVTPAMAGGGGGAESSDHTAGGAGGTDQADAAGGAGGVGSPGGGGGGSGGGGGGGGAGATGGAGRAGGSGDGGAESGGFGGAGGTANGGAGGHGVPGVTYGGSGGGGGGGHGYVDVSLPTAATAGGAGGAGGGSGASGGAGGGGAGGYGAVVTGTGILHNIGTLSTPVTGGNGGAGGSAPYDGGNGGTGGAGLVFTQSNIILTVNSAVTGGNGGAGGASPVANGSAGAGGAGIIGDGLGIIIGAGGYVTGGLNGSGTNRANAITFTGGSNVLVFESATSHLTGNIDLTGVLTFSAGNTEVSNAITGTGSVLKAGSPTTLILSGANTYTGTTTVAVGALLINGSVTSDVTVTPNGTLGGSGTITGNVTNSGTLAPGNSIGTLTIAGNYSSGAASVYEVEANAAGQSDRLNVTGTATLDGRVAVLAESGNYRRNTTYTILNAAGGIAGTFTGGVTSNLAFLTPSLSYDLNNVYLLLARNATSFADVALTANQRSVASALDRGGLSATGDMAAVIDALFGLSSPQARSAYERMGGAAHTALSGASLFAFNRYIGTMSSRMGEFIAGGPTLAYTGTPLYASRTDILRDAGNAMRRADAVPAWGFWAQGYGSTGDRRGADIASRYDYDMAGVVMGFDRKVRDDLLVGAAFGYSHTKATMNELSESGTVESYNGSLYGTWKSRPFYVSGIAAFGYNRYDTTREIAFGTITRRATGTYGGTAAGGYVETGYVVKTAPVDIIPIAALQGTYLSRGSFTERNASSMSLDADSDQTSSLLSSLGVRMRKDYKVTSGTVSPELSLRWDHEFVNDDFAVNAAFAGSPVSTFTVRGDRPDRDSLGVDAGVLWQTADNLYLHLSYNGNFSGDDTNHGGTAGVKYRW